ncbi:MAG: nucleotide exchange factor GrpE [Candidatus Micrarchaeota archaeon]|nr:nucleotide exchange factor GrpE [Candidatus Micrarchaeota archaeon]
MADDQEIKDEAQNAEQAEVAGPNAASVNETKEDTDARYSEMKDKMLRIAAEFDNYKKRTKADMERAEALGKAELVRSLLPIIDEFEIAVISMSGTQDKNLLKGVEMLYSNFIGTLKKDGLTEVNVDGTFDPYRHEIVMMREDGAERGTILEVVKKGYMLEDMMIRPASVIVSDGKAQEKEKENADVNVKTEE